MMKQLEKAKELLNLGGYTCVLCQGERTYTSTRRGVKPLVDWLESKQDFNGFFAADKVVGKGAAYLYVLLGVQGVYAQVISKPALQVLNRYGIFTRYETLVDAIINRQGNGICPFEQAVLEIYHPTAAYEAIRQKIKELNIL